MSLLFAGLQELEAAETVESSASVLENSDSSVTSRIGFRSTTLERMGLERPGTSDMPPLYSDVALSSKANVVFLPRPQAVGSPGHPHPLSLPLGDGSSLDSLDRRAAGQEDEEDEDEEEESNDCENLGNELSLSPGDIMLPPSQGRPASLRPDGDSHSTPSS